MSNRAFRLMKFEDMDQWKIWRALYFCRLFLYTAFRMPGASSKERFEGGPTEADPLSRHTLTDRIPATMHVISPLTGWMPIPPPIIVAVRIMSGRNPKHHAEP